MIIDGLAVEDGLRTRLGTKPDKAVLGDRPYTKMAVCYRGRLDPSVVVAGLDAPYTDSMARTEHIRRLWPHVFVIAPTLCEGELIAGRPTTMSVARPFLSCGRSDDLLTAIRDVKRTASVTYVQTITRNNV